MANRRFEMHEYRHVIHRMRLGESDRAIAKAGLIGGASARPSGRWRGEGLAWTAGRFPMTRSWFGVIDGGRKPRVCQACVTDAYQDYRFANGSVRAFRRRPSIGRWYRSRALPAGHSSVRRMVRRIRGECPKATCVLDFAPGEAAQVDFGKGPTITDVFTGAVTKTWIFVMTLCFSRHMYAEIVTDQKKIIGFHNMAVKDQADVLKLLYSENIDLMGFKELFLRSYKDDRRFKLLRKVFMDATKMVETDPVVISLEDNQKNNLSTKELLKSFFMKEGSTPSSCATILSRSSSMWSMPSATRWCRVRWCLTWTGRSWRYPASSTAKK